jgi:hypothetical protein
MSSLSSSPSSPQDQALKEPSHTSNQHWHLLRPGAWISDAAEPYPPKPYFESFNLWPTKTKTGSCLTIVAGRQQMHASTANTTRRSITRMDDYSSSATIATTKMGSGGVRCLSRGLFGWCVSGESYGSLILLQSLRDCSTLAYDVRSATFKPDSFNARIPCPSRS